MTKSQWTQACLIAAAALVLAIPPHAAASEAAQAASAPPPASAPGAGETFDALGWLRSHYTKQEYLVPMRDGVRLFTTAYRPKDNSTAWPILLNRTPYGLHPYGEDNLYEDSRQVSRRIKPAMLRDGYIFVFQDVRGRMKSEGEFVHVRPHQPLKRSSADIDESSDTWDTIDWLVKNLPGNNGRVGMWGISYPGFYATCGLIDAHPALKAVSPQAPVTDWFIGDDFRHNGAVFLPHGFNFLGPFAVMGPATPRRPNDQQWRVIDHGTGDGYEFFRGLLPLSEADSKWFGRTDPYWQEILAHDTYDDYWQARDIRRHLGAVRPAVLTVGGWFDAEDLFGALETWRALERGGKGNDSRLVMGPWVHGGWGRSAGDGLGKVRFDSKTAEFYRDTIELPFFAHHLKGKPDPGLPEAFVFETGTNQWRRHDAWPPRGAEPRTFWLAGAEALADRPMEAGGFDEYVSDPHRPVPFIEETAIGMTQEYMVADQRFASRRTDVLVYSTPPLESPITAAGPIEVSLRVSTSGTDSDWVVKLIDVYPGTFPDPPPLAGKKAPEPDEDDSRLPDYSPMGGYQQLVRGEPFRGRFRKSFSAPEPFVPGEPATVAFRMPDVYHTFRRGHRLMVQIQSTWFPLVDRNPQSFITIATAQPSEYRKATQRVYRGGPDGSSITIQSYRGE